MNANKPLTYAVIHKDEDIRVKSRSGGIFTALSDEILRMNGVVYGCILDENFKAIHVRALDWKTRDLMRGSKYVQSEIGDCFKMAKNDLELDRYVLFSGTSCQIAGLRCFLKKDYEKLICVDIVCHGVPSPLVWEKYLNWQMSRNKALISVDFRNKNDFGWRDHVETLRFKDKTINSRVFTNFFLSENILRPACYECKYKTIVHPGDITIADYWGIENNVPEFNDNKGVSLVLINSEKGKFIFDNIVSAINYKHTKIENSMQPALIQPFKKPITREVFWKNLFEKDFETIVKIYGKDSLKKRIKMHLKLIKVKIYRFLQLKTEVNNH